LPGAVEDLLLEIGGGGLGRGVEGEEVVEAEAWAESEMRKRRRNLMGIGQWVPACAGMTRRATWTAG
jgi:hypothetical protein